ncbi:MAG: citrate transporter, partial [Deltaproteobacteria bacterium]|nr:citrate transporter [Deltaproteobacteria bacterium]
MKNRLVFLTLLVCLLWTLPVFGSGGGKADPARPAGPTDLLIVSGTITNLQGKPVKEVGLHFYLNGQKLELEEEIVTSKAGGYEAELKVPKGLLPASKVELEAAKPSYQSSARTALDKVLPERVDERGNAVFLAHQSLKMKRAISPAFWIATLVLLLVYVL